MSKVYTSWTKATKSPYEAIAGLLACLGAGKNAWIEMRKNGDQEFPIMKKNPALDNLFNWTVKYGTPRNEDELKTHDWFNDTEKALTYNYVACYGDKAAAENYQKTGTVMKTMFEASKGGRHVWHPVAIKDANYYRKEIKGDGYEYGYWVTWWKPKDGIPYYVVDDVGDVFVICYDDGPVDEKDAMTKAAEFLMKCAAV